MPVRILILTITRVAGAWFRKARDVPLQRERYLDCVKSANYTTLRPDPVLTAADYVEFQRRWDEWDRANASVKKSTPAAHIR